MSLISRYGSGANHSVQFYSEDQFLVETTSRFLAAALQGGNAAIVVADQARRASIAQRLQAIGVDLPRVRSLRRYIEFDAEETLSKIAVDDWPDSALFSECARDMIAQALTACRADQRGVAVFGEMVNVLCARGRLESAIRLEQLWNELLETQPIALRCGYSVATFNQETDADALLHVCAQHREVFPAEGYLGLESEQDRFRYVAQLQQEAEALKTEIRERHRAQEALVRAEKGAALGRLAASIAHEINNPLNALTNLFYLLQAQTSLDPTARHYASLADQELQRIARITKQMLGFYRESPSPIPCKLSEIVDNILELYESPLAKSNISVDRHYAVEGVIEGFPAELRQLFANLIGNAIEATGTQGKISVRISFSRSWANPRQAGVRVSVADSGAGITVENRQRIFDPFFTTKGEGGTGLGLWVSQGIVHKHYGQIRVRSKTEKGRYRGTIFSLFFPVLQHKRQRQPSQVADASSAGQYS
ncbi:MAG TPA: ATP-binding protein [Terriglobales bacterium]